VRLEVAVTVRFFLLIFIVILISPLRANMIKKKSKITMKRPRD